uniref:Ubiquitin-like domain-containing protein n=1 Tax=Aegilops tauschii subsp. strangulata TaxID=200361 RepID=A0A453DLT6_AEGTS
MSKLQLPADDSVALRVTHSNLASFASDIRVSQQTTVEALKEKLWKKTGTAVGSMRLELRDEAGARVADLDRDAAPLAAYSPYDGYRLHIIDLDPSSVTSGGWLEDTSLVEKYTISDEAYDKLGTNFRKFKEKMVSKNPVSDDKQVSCSCSGLVCSFQGFNRHTHASKFTLFLVLFGSQTIIWRNCVPTSRWETDVKWSQVPRGAP